MRKLSDRLKQWLWGRSTIVLGGSAYERCSDEFITGAYERAGRAFGDMVSYLPSMGRACGYEEQEAEWRALEAEYVRRGYEPISLSDFVKWGGYDEEPSNRRKQQEKVKEVAK